MHIPNRLVVFTDLDGTLLDHETYDFSAAAPVLAQLVQAATPVVLASSKTAAEVRHWQQRLGLNDWPAIVENGAGVVGGAAPPVYARLRAALAAQGAPFTGFGDMTLAQVARHTGLSLRDAALARQRDYSEPGLWHGTDAQLAVFLKDLADQGITARRGGRFLTLSYGGTKADRMADIAAGLNAGVTVALGDAPNDAEMLARADYAIVVRNDHGPGPGPLPGGNSGRVYRTQASGPAGWAEGMRKILNDLA